MKMSVEMLVKMLIEVGDVTVEGIFDGAIVGREEGDWGGKFVPDAVRVNSVDSVGTYVARRGELIVGLPV